MRPPALHTALRQDTRSGSMAGACNCIVVLLRWHNSLHTPSDARPASISPRGSIAIDQFGASRPNSEHSVLPTIRRAVVLAFQSEMDVQVRPHYSHWSWVPAWTPAHHPPPADRPARRPLHAGGPAPAEGRRAGAAHRPAPGCQGCADAAPGGAEHQPAGGGEVAQSASPSLPRNSRLPYV